MKRLLLILVALGLTGCATEAKYRTLLDSFNGVDELTLIRRWGPPDQVYEAQGHRFLVYRQQQSMLLPGAEPVYQTTLSGNTAYTRGYGGYPPAFVTLFCATTFDLVEGKVLGSSYRGSNCTAN